MSLYANGSRRQELITCLRHRTLLSEADISDEDLLKRTKNTFMFAEVELKMSISKPKKGLNYKSIW